jgi:hypothetical protein
MTAPAKLPRPAATLPADGRGTVPLTTLLEALERAETALTKASAEGIAAVSELLAGAQELTARLGDLRRLTALAEEWEAEAGDDLTGESGLARQVALRMCARQLRSALAYGGTG